MLTQIIVFYKNIYIFFHWENIVEWHRFTFLQVSLMSDFINRRQLHFHLRLYSDCCDIIPHTAFGKLHCACAKTKVKSK